MTQNMKKRKQFKMAATRLGKNNRNAAVTTNKACDRKGNNRNPAVTTSKACARKGNNMNPAVTTNKACAKF